MDNRREDLSILGGAKVGMTEKEQIALLSIVKTIENISNGVYVDMEPMTADTAISEEIGVLFDKVSTLNRLYGESRNFIVDLSRGKLNTNSPRGNSFANPYKQLHSELMHLTWQIQQIAEGDYDQKVSFSGDFSTAINKMIEALRERENLRIRNMENEAKMIEYTNKLRISNETKDRLFSIISHDLRNPFGVIVGFSNILLSEVRSGSIDQLESYAQAINDSALRTQELLSNLLEWARLQTGSITVIPQYIDLNSIIRSNIEIADVTAREKNISILFDNEDNKPLFTDKAIVNTILRNLLGNAVKYTPDGGNISISIEQNPDYYKISVTDSGVGMSQENLDKLFHIDTIQSTPGTNREKGTGLGLVLCYDFVKKLGGEIGVESQLGQGSTFFFTIPINQPDQDEALLFS